MGIYSMVVGYCQVCVCSYYINHYIVSGYPLEKSDILQADEDLTVGYNPTKEQNRQ
jgi:hypothetical protein